MSLRRKQHDRVDNVDRGDNGEAVTPMMIAKRNIIIFSRIEYIVVLTATQKTNDIRL